PKSLLPPLKASPSPVDSIPPPPLLLLFQAEGGAPPTSVPPSDGASMGMEEPLISISISIAPPSDDIDAPGRFGSKAVSLSSRRLGRLRAGGCVVLRKPRSATGPVFGGGVTGCASPAPADGSTKRSSVLPIRRMS